MFDGFFDGFFDDIIDIASLRNLFTPLVSFFEDILYGPGVFFGVSLLAGFTKREIRKVLEDADVDAWGFIDDSARYTIIFNVQEEHTQLAIDALNDAKVPILYPKQVVAQNASSDLLNRIFEAIGW